MNRQERRRQEKLNRLQAKTDSKVSLEVLYRDAVRFLKGGELDQAEALFNDLIAKKPDEPGLWQMLGITYLQGERNEEALEVFDRLLAQDGTNFAVVENKGIALKGLGRLEEAKACFERGLEIRPDSSEAQNNLGTVLHEQGDLDAAEETFRRALKGAWGYADAHFNLGRVLRTKGKPEAALGSLHEAQRVKPDWIEVGMEIVEALVDLGRYEVARTEVDKWCERAPGFAAVHDLRKRVLARTQG